MSDTPPTLTPPEATPQVRFTRGSGGLATTPEQSQRLAEMLKRAGVSEERLQQAAQFDGITLTKTATDARSTVEKMYDRATGLASTPATPAGYKFGFGTVPADVAPQLQTGLQKMQLPQSVGSAIGEYAAQDAAQYNTLTPEQRQAYDFAELQKFTALHPKNADEARQDVANLLTTWRNAQPDVVDNLLRQGWFRSARTQTLLAQHARNLLRRGELTKVKK